MSDDPQLYELNDEDNQAATKGDVAELVRMTAKGFQGVDDRFETVERRFDGVEAHLTGVESRLDKVEAHLNGVATRMDGLESRMSRLERGQAAVLTVLESIEGRLKDWQHIPAKVERVYKHVFPHR